MSNTTDTTTMAGGRHAFPSGYALILILVFSGEWEILDPRELFVERNPVT